MALPLPLILAGLGLLTGGAKSAVQADQAARQRKRDAETIKYSPWTHLRPQGGVEEPNVVGDLLSGAVAGASFGQQFGGGKNNSQPSFVDAAKTMSKIGPVSPDSDAFSEWEEYLKFKNAGK